MTVVAQDIAVALGRTIPSLTATETAQWQIWIADALMLIEARLGDPSALDQARLDYVVREAVLSHIRHPDDATRVEISVDDARSARSYTTGKGRVRILDEWWDLLSPAAASGAFVVDTVGAGGLVAGHLPWCSLAFGAAYCSCGMDIAGYPIFEGA